MCIVDEVSEGIQDVSWMTVKEWILRKSNSLYLVLKWVVRRYSDHCFMRKTGPRHLVLVHGSYDRLAGSREATKYGQSSKLQKFSTD